jgi:hypothetical protein
MVSQRYSVGNKKTSQWKRLVIVALLSLLIFGGIVTAFIWEARKSDTQSQTENEAASEQMVRELMVDEEYFSLILPEGWQETARFSTKKERSITWQSEDAFSGGELKLYIDTIPANLAIKRLLPLIPAKDKLTDDQLSNDCNEFKGAKKNRKNPQKVTHEGISFWCDIPSAQVRIGTGAKGATNTTTVKGQTKGEHKYFFVYTDEDAQQDVSALTAAIMSFQAK